MEEKEIIPEWKVELDKYSKYISNWRANPYDSDWFELNTYLTGLISDIFNKLSDNYKIGFTSDEITWCRRNESNMWAYFIENELLYSSDPLIINRFINDGPFTAPFHHDSPARAALWVGWQIIRAYMNQNPDNTPADLLLTKLHAREILSASRYKPRRFIF